MRWSWKIAKVLGIEVRAHVTFVALLAWIAVSTYVVARTAAATLHGVAFTLAIFAIVVLHELGHALTARRLGIRTRDITLLPIGGVSRFERLPDEPGQELLIAVAGPAVNIVLAAAIYAGLRAAGAEIAPIFEIAPEGPSWSGLLWANLALAAFNMLPAFPMDGGRALRALLAMRTDHAHATEIAARLGQGLALVIGAIGFFANALLVFVALFVWIGAVAENAAVQVKALLQGVPVRAAMLTRFATLDGNDTLGMAAAQLLAGSDMDFPVLEEGRLVGVLQRSELIRGLAERGAAAHVHAVMRTRFPTASPGELLDQALVRMESAAMGVEPVLDDGVLVGLVTAEGVAELMMVERALRPGRVGGSWKRRLLGAGA